MRFFVYTVSDVSSFCFRQRIACMKLEEYQTAKAALELGASLAPGESRFAKLIQECDESIAGALLVCYMLFHYKIVSSIL